MGEFHSQAAAAFHPSSAIKSLQMQMLPERHAAAAATSGGGGGGGGVGAERGAARRGPASASRGGGGGVIVHREAAACSAFWISSRIDILYLRLLRNVRHRPSRGGKKERETEGENV